MYIKTHNSNIIYAASWRAERKPWTIISGSLNGGIYNDIKITLTDNANNSDIFDIPTFEIDINPPILISIDDNDGNIGGLKTHNNITTPTFTFSSNEHAHLSTLEPSGTTINDGGDFRATFPASYDNSTYMNDFKAMKLQ